MAYGKRFSRQRPHDAAYSSRAPSVKESARALAARYGLNAKTVRKWRKRTTTADEPMGPKTPKSTVLTPAEEAIVGAFRQKTLLHLMG
jgi:transposase-like protein